MRNGPFIFCFFIVTPVLWQHACCSEFSKGNNEIDFVFLWFFIMISLIPKNKVSCGSSAYRRPHIFYPITSFTAFSKAFFTFCILLVNVSWYTLTSNIMCASSTPFPKKGMTRTTSIVTKPTNAKQHYFLISCTNCHINRRINVGIKDSTRR